MKRLKFRKWFAVLLAVVVLLGAFPVTPASAASSSNVILDIPWAYINQCGHQAVSGPCQAYCWAYCRIILDNKPHTYLDYYISGVGGVAPATAGYNSRVRANTTADLLKAIYDNINLGRPVMVGVRGSKKSDGTYRDHFVVAIGYRAGCNRDQLTQNDIIILDPANKAIAASAGSSETYTFLGSYTVSSTNAYWTAKSGGVRVINSSSSTSSSSSSSSASNTSGSSTASASNALTVKSTENGSWFVYVPENYKLLLYSGAASTTSATYCSARSASYRIVCSQKATLSNGTVRYYGVFNTDDHYWLTYTNGMTVKSENVVKARTVNFSANGGAVSPTAKTVTYGDPYGTLPTPTRSGYTFDGWYTAPSGGTRVTSSDIVSLSSDQATLYAHWTAVQQAPAALSVVSQTTGNWIVTCPIGRDVVLYKKASADASSGVYVPDEVWHVLSCTQKAVLSDGTVRYGTKLSINGTKSVYWIALTSDMSIQDNYAIASYAISFDANGGTVSPEMKIVTDDILYSAVYGTLPTPTRSGYTFDGWYTAPNGGSRVTASSTLAVNGDHTLYAHWSAIFVSKPATGISVTNGYRYLYIYDKKTGELAKQIGGDSYEVHMYPGSTYQLNTVVTPADTTDPIQYSVQISNNNPSNGGGIHVSSTGLVSTDDTAYGDASIVIKCGSCQTTVYIIMCNTAGELIKRPA